MTNKTVLSLLVSAWVALQLGILHGTSIRRRHRRQRQQQQQNDPDCIPTTYTTRRDGGFVEAPLPPITLKRTARSGSQSSPHNIVTPFGGPLLQSPPIWGLSTVDTIRFNQMFRLGAPWYGKEDEPTDGSTSVLMLYMHNSSVPDDHHNTSNIRSTIRTQRGVSGSTSSSAIVIPHRSISKATHNCRQVKQVVTHLGKYNRLNAQSCLAIVSNSHESYQVQKWIQYKPNPLHSTSNARNWTMIGRYVFHEPYKTVLQDLSATAKRNKRKFAFIELGQYLSVLDDALERLKPIAAQVANAGTNNRTVGSMIVLTVNYGHAELLVNYICAARAAGIDLNKILVFAADPPTYQLTKSLGIAAFFDKQIYAAIPTAAAGVYGDSVYSKVMMIKAYCSHLVSQLGYHFLFQDVDIIPYQPNYLEWWLDHTKTGFDLYFQTDFSGRADYSPWSANSGCYFAVNNARTQYFFSMLVLQGDLIGRTRSHQSPMHALLSEHRSQLGLRVKVLKDEHQVIPMGYHYHRDPMIFMDPLYKNNTMSMHMNWNDHKGAKREFLEQLGDWYVTDHCLNQTSSTKTSGTRSGLETCCASLPEVVCHYKDLPSIVSCRRSPPFVEGRRSLWKPVRAQHRTQKD